MKDTVKSYFYNGIKVSALQWTGENIEDMQEFCDGAWIGFDWESHQLFILNLVANIGDFVIKTPENELRVCKGTDFSSIRKPI